MCSTAGWLPVTRATACTTRLPEGFAGFSTLGRAQYIEIITFLTGYLLHSQGDRMLMGNSVEGRFPFLDHRVAEFAARLPDGAKLRRSAREVPAASRRSTAACRRTSSRREKRPYRAPILRAFMGRGAPAYVGDLLESGRLREAGHLRAERRRATRSEMPTQRGRVRERER